MQESENNWLSWENFCPFCNNYQPELGVCQAIHENVRSYPRRFLKKCSRKYFVQNKEKPEVEKSKLLINEKKAASESPVVLDTNDTSKKIYQTKIKILDDKVIVYSDMDFNASPIKELGAGDEIVLARKKSRVKNNVAWLEIILPNGQIGYINESTRKFIINHSYQLLQETVDVYEQPSSQSVLKKQYKIGDTFYVLDMVKKEEKQWLKIRNHTGSEGFINENTKIGEFGIGDYILKSIGILVNILRQIISSAISLLIPLSIIAVLSGNNLFTSAIRLIPWCLGFGLLYTLLKYSGFLGK